MSFDTLYLEKEVSSNVTLTKEAPVGFSWTILFFGWIVCIFRKDWKWMAIIFLMTLLQVLFISQTAAPIINIVMAFMYNKIYVKDLLDKGYIATGTKNGRDQEVIANIGIKLNFKKA